MEKKIMIVVGIVVVAFLLGIITKGKSWPFIVAGGLAYAVYKNNRY